MYFEEGITPQNALRVHFLLKQPLNHSMSHPIGHFLPVHLRTPRVSQGIEVARNQGPLEDRWMIPISMLPTYTLGLPSAPTLDASVHE